MIWEQIQFCLFVRNDQSAVSLFSPARSSLVRASLTVSRILKTPPSPSLSRSTPSVSSVNNTRACKYTQLRNCDHHDLDVNETNQQLKNIRGFICTLIPITKNHRDIGKLCTVHGSFINKQSVGGSHLQPKLSDSDGRDVEINDLVHLGNDEGSETNVHSYSGICAVCRSVVIESYN